MKKIFLFLVFAASALTAATDGRLSATALSLEKRG